MSTPLQPKACTDGAAIPMAYLDQYTGRTSAAVVRTIQDTPPPVMQDDDSVEHWAMITRPMSSELVAQLRLVLGDGANQQFKRTRIGCGYYISRDPVILSQSARFLGEAALGMHSDGMSDPAKQVQTIASALELIRSTSERDMHFWDWGSKQWMVAIGAGIGLGVGIFGIGTALGHDIYSGTKSKVALLWRRITKKDDDDSKGPPSAGGGGKSLVIVAEPGTRISIVVPDAIDLPENTDNDPRLTDISAAELRLALLGTGLVAAGAAAVFLTPELSVGAAAAEGLGWAPASAALAAVTALVSAPKPQ